MNIFSNLNSEASIAVLLWLLGAFLIGFVTAWIYWRRRNAALQNEYDQLKVAHTKLSKEFDDFRASVAPLQADFETASAELKEVRVRIKAIEVEKGDLHTEIYKMKDKLKIEMEANRSLGLQLENLNERYLALQATEGEVLGDSATAPVASNEIGDLKEKIGELEDEIEGFSIQNATLASEKENIAIQLKQSNARIEALRAKVEGLEEELAATQTSLQACIETKTALEAEVGEPTARAVEPLSEAEEVEMAKVAVAAALGSKIVAVSVEEKDDLKIISGIGPFIENKLNELGIFAYQQIAAFDKPLIDQITKAIQFFPGRIERDNWVGQAAELYEKKKSE